MSFCGLGSAYFESFAKLVPPLDLYCHFVRFDCVKQFHSPPALPALPHDIPSIVLSIWLDYIYPRPRSPEEGEHKLYGSCSHFINSRTEVTALRRVFAHMPCGKYICTYIHMCMYLCMSVCVSSILCCKPHKLGQSFSVNSSCSRSYLWHLSTQVGRAQEKYRTLSKLPTLFAGFSIIVIDALRQRAICTQREFSVCH